MSANVRFCSPRMNRASAIALLLSGVVLQPAYAEEDYERLPWMAEEVANYHKEQKQLQGDSLKGALLRAEKYLNSLRTIRADFTQTDPNGGSATGKFFLERPGKMRWQYNPPVPILMVTKGSSLVYVDYELEQVTHIPLQSTIAGVIAQKTIDLEKDVDIIEVRAGAGSIRIALAQKGELDEGLLVLEFEEEPTMRLSRMVIGDATGQMTRIDLSEAEYNIALDDSLFTFTDPRGEDKLRVRR